MWTFRRVIELGLALLTAAAGAQTSVAQEPDPAIAVEQDAALHRADDGAGVANDVGTMSGFEAVADTRTPVFMVIAGGVSLGSYEAGYAMTVIDAIRRAPDLTLAGVSGTSAGAINALAAALESCRIEDSEEFEDVGWRIWIPIGWRMLYDEARVSREAVFHREDLLAHGLPIVRGDGLQLRADCEVPIVVAVTRSAVQPEDTIREGEPLVHLVDHLTVVLTADPETGQPRYRNLDAELRREWQLHGLIADAEGRVAPEEVLKVITASAAFPMAFAPVDLDVCPPDGPGTCGADEALRLRYHDGGVFENVPVQPIAGMVEAAGPTAEVIVIDMKSPVLPRGGDRRETTGNPFEAVRMQTESWLEFARLRSYAVTLQELEARNTPVRRAHQRWPLASEQLFAFLGFMDIRFRELDYALGAEDAFRDVGTWPAPWNTALRRELLDARSLCMHSLLTDTNWTPGCAVVVPRDLQTAMRAIGAIVWMRCEEWEDSVPATCTEMLQLAWRTRLPQGSDPGWTDRLLSYGIGRPGNPEFRAFLAELQRGPFDAELAQFISEGGLLASSRRPELIWSSLLERAFRSFVAAQGRGQFLGQLVAESTLDALLPILPRRSFGLLANLNQLEGTVEFPLFPGARLGLGLVAEWSARSDRERAWHLISGGPVIRLGMLTWRRQSLVHLIASLDAGMQLGPVFPGVEALESVRFGTGRAEFSPNAAIFVGIAPRVLLLRRLQLDFPLRFYWLCTTPYCSETASSTPVLSFTFRLGWSWQWPPRPVD